MTMILATVGNLVSRPAMNASATLSLLASNNAYGVEQSSIMRNATFAERHCDRKTSLMADFVDITITCTKR
ncbi:hypothetical protein A9973_30335 [Achromobacter sp. UMC46]|nr:hypothetical protein [Achromobacter sp. UMC46]MBB1598373.1 hypothetical protein [Achromobacter sp. UMC46]